MCGIFAVYDYNGDVVAFRERAVLLSQRYFTTPLFLLCINLILSQID